MRSNGLKALVLTLALLGLTWLPAGAQTSLIATGSVWKYLDDGTDQGTAWRGTNFNDVTWFVGAAQFGYGENDEATPLMITNAAGVSNLTFYFRQTFTVADPGAISNLLLRVLRDDGAVVYLNDVEIFRSNMPTGEVTYATVASSAVGGTDETTYFATNPNPALLVSGTNLLAVEIHQSGFGSSDVSFDLELLANFTPVPPSVAITSPINGTNVAAVSVTLQATASDTDGAVVLVEFFQNANKIGEDATAPYSFTATGLAPGTYTFFARATDSTGLSQESATVVVQVSAPPPTLIALNADWKYLVTPVAADPNWINLNFDDTSWPSGPAELGYGDNDEATPIGFGPDSNNKYPTTYFRRKFEVSDPSAYASLSMTLVYDDGAVVYLNGAEVYRINMPTGPIDYTTFASGANDYGPDISALSPSVLVAGPNIIAVEMHQGNAGSSDISMALQLQGLLPPTVSITSPSNGATFTVPVSFTLAATASDSDGTVVRVEFYEGFTLLGSDITAPYSITVSNLIEGPHTITAVAIDNSGASGTSTPITINVTDPNPPVLLSAAATTNTVTVTFSKRVVEPSATAVSNYVINNGAVVQSAAYGANSNTIVLTTTLLSPGPIYTLTVNNVQDGSGNTIAANSQTTFEVVGFTSTAVGNPAIPGSVSSAGNGYDVTGAGTDIGGTTDQFRFNYEPTLRSGDFDVKVRLDGFAAASTWAKAGLMARESLLGNSRYAGSFATPSVSGCFFQYRFANAGNTTNAGYAPVTYPNTWLRLRRVGNVFTGYASPDGNNWVTLGTITIALPGNVYLGMAVTSRDATQTATARFRDYGSVVGGTIGSLVLNREPLGPSSRKTGLVLTEIMYHPRGSTDYSNSVEFVEIFNSQSFFENIGGYRLSGAIDYTFPSNTVLQAGQFLVVARNPAYLQSTYGLTGVLGPWEGAETNGLPGGQGRVRLRGKAGEVLLEVNYEGGPPWPVQADGAGHSLVLAKPSYGEGDVRAWEASDRIGGSPGGPDPYASDPLDVVVINEFLAHTDDPQEDFIELYNHSNSSVDLSGAYLSDEAETNKFRIPNGTILPARGFTNYPQSTLGFALRSAGERIYLVNSNQTRVIDAVAFDAQENGVSTGRFPDGAPSFYRMASLTPGASNNNTPRNDPIVINEIMYSPISGDSEDEYIELYNRSGAPVDVGLWRFVAGINYTIPPNTVIASNGYLVIAKNVTRLLGNYVNLNAANCIGDFGGTLANAGERIALAKPDFEVTTNNNVLVTNIHYIVVNEVTYRDGGRWGNWSDGGGSSLELRDPDSDNRQAANWADSDESSKGIWTVVQITGTMGETLSTPANRLQIFLLGIGECLVDEVEVRTVTGTNVGPNLVGSNNGFESGITGWFVQGSHDQSSLENVGLVGARSLHLRAASRGDNGGNRVYVPLTAAPGSTVTLRAWVKWLRGWPEILLRLHGGGIEIGGRLNIQSNLGTPGAANSRLVANAGPAIYDVAHTPILPAASEAVVVTARASDPDTPYTLRLKYRVDPSLTYSDVTMVDNGTGADSVAGDGIYSGTLPGRPAGTTVAFYLEGVDALGATNTFPQDVFPAPPLVRVFPTDAPRRECVVRWGDTQLPGSFGTYRLWLTATNTTRWNVRRPVLNNAVMDATFVYNNYRVVYNMKPQYAGSPWHRGQMTSGPDGGQRVDYDIEFPEDDRFLGATDLVWNYPGNPGGTSSSDASCQSEQTSYEIFKQIGVQYNYRRYVHVFVNGSHRSTISGRAGTFIMEDSQQANNDIVEEWFPDDTDGTLYKIEDWFEFPDNGDDFTANNDADLQRRHTTTNGVTTIHLAAYRFMWRLRARGAGESANDYSDFVDMLNTVSPTLNTGDPINVPAIESILDYEQWMRIFACQHTCGNWDSYGYERGKNAYTYKPRNGKFHQWTWDIDFTMGIGGDGAGVDYFNTTDPRISVMWNTPAIRRAYLRAYQDIVNGPLQNSYMDPILDAKAAALALNSVNYDPGAVNTIKSFIAAQRNAILSQLLPSSLTATPFNVSGTNNFSTNNNIVTFTGTAAINIKDIYVNGAQYPVTWTSVSNWQARVVLIPGTNSLVIQGYDSRGNLVANASRTNTVNYTGGDAAPEDYVVINEIMFNPLVPGAEYVELFNTHSTLTFDLTGFVFNGLDYTFPPGSYIGPRSYLVLCKDRAAFIVAYGTSPAVFGQFDGNLQADGETITLIKPGPTPEQDVVIDKVLYEAVRPWPVGTNDVMTASSIQLLDMTQDNSRPANWNTRYVPAVYSPEVFFPGATNSGWKWVTYTQTIQGSTNQTSQGTNFLIFLNTPGGEVFVDDLVLVLGTVPESGPNLLQNGDFESPFTGPWTAAGNHSGSGISGALAHSGTSSLRVLATGAGSLTANVKQIIQGFTSNVTATLSFWYYATTNATNLTLRTSPGSAFNNTTNVQPLVIPPSYTPPQLITPAVVSVSPAAANQLATNLTPIPPIWINEVQPNNENGIMDNLGQREPWIEIYNAGTGVVSLAGLYLADNYLTVDQWAFPAGASLNPGEFKVVFADGNTNQTTATEWHTNFRLPSGTGSVALARITYRPEVLDYINYQNIRTNYSYGAFPDGQPFTKFEFYYVTPGGTNDASSPPLQVFINEWMARNTGFLLDPADNDTDDWLELYNPNPVPVDVSGYYLTDVLTDKTKARIPGGTVIPPHGFVLLWADNEPNQNAPGREGHLGFRIDADGDDLTLYTPNGELLDRVVFNGQQQTANVSMGRFPDGAAALYSMPGPTPRTNNAIPAQNAAPTITPIPNKTLTLGQTLTFTVMANDSDVPAQSLTFDLTTAPGGATIGASSGVFSWTPASAPQTVPVTVRVRDSGSPQMSATASFNVSVVQPPVLGVIAGNGQVTLSFPVVPGRRYTVLYTDSLDAPIVWTPLPQANNVLATGSTLTINDNTGGSQRFYLVSAAKVVD